MKTTIKALYIPAVICMLGISGCTKMRDAGILQTGNFTDTTGPLKDAIDIPVGVAIDYTPMTSDGNYSAIVKRDFNRVTFGYQMKHGAIVKDNGTMDFSKTDALVSAVGDMPIFGHTLAWHQNQNATWLKNYSHITVSELLTNAGFELGGAADFTDWTPVNLQNASTMTVTTTASELHSGKRAMKVAANVGDATGQWKVQIGSNFFATDTGVSYNVSFYIKAATGTGSVRLSTQTSGGGTPQYQGDQAVPSTAYTLISWSFKANSPQTRIMIELGAKVNTYLIDDASVKESPAAAFIAAKLDTALGTFITANVNRYKNKVHAWDVVNELFADDGKIRNNANTLPQSPPADMFVWSEYLGRDYALKAFNYAKAADPSALFFINDYALESRPAKLDSLISMVKELKAKGAKIDGIGTQMHIAWNTSYDAIDQMMKKLAGTGLLIHMSELDVKINPSFRSGFALTPLEANYQAEMYKYVVQSYLKNIPKAQQFGITIWGITDNTSWLYSNGQEFPLLYNADYTKKQAYAAVLKALKGQ